MYRPRPDFCTSPAFAMAKSSLRMLPFFMPVTSASSVGDIGSVASSNAARMLPRSSGAANICRFAGNIPVSAGEGQGAFLLLDVASADVESDAVLIAVEHQRSVGAGGKAVRAAERLKRIVGAAFAGMVKRDDGDTAIGRPALKPARAE